MSQEDIELVCEAGEWRVRQSGSGAELGRFRLVDDAQAAAHREALRRAPCWVRIYTPEGAFRLGYHVR